MKHSTLFLLLLTAVTAAAQTTSPGWQSPYDDMDSDRDGVPDSKDACNHTAPGKPLVIKGCSALDLAQRPEVLIAPLNKDLDVLIARLGVRTDAFNVVTTLRQARADWDTAGKQIRSAAVCDGSQNFTFGMNALAAALAALQGMAANARSALPATRTRTAYADTTDADTSLLDLQMRVMDLDAIARRGRLAQGAFAGVCGRVIGNTARGQVTTIDDSNHRIVLDDGLIVGGFTFKQDPSVRFVQNDLLQLNGAVFNDGSVLISRVDLVQGLPYTVLTVAPCMKLKLAPVQPDGAPAIVHDLEGYRYGSKYTIEIGSRFTASTADCTSDSPRQPHKRWIWLYLRYIDKDTQAQEDTMLANGIYGPTDAVGLPSYILDSMDLNSPVSLRMEYADAVAQGFDQNGKPWFPVFSIIAKASIELDLRPRHSLCTAVYNLRHMNVPDNNPAAFVTDSVIGQNTPVQPDPGWPMTFKAMAFRWFANNTTSYPNAQQIVDGMPFAVFNQFVPDFFDPNMENPEDLVGVSKASALMWPRITSYHNNREFSYSCDVPEISRDVVDICAAPTDSYHKLPYEGGYPDWWLGQGNFGGFTHQGLEAYAFDFGSAANTPIYAARGGVVKMVVSDQSGNSYSDPGCNCTANTLVIEHQDGTQTSYYHFPQNGVYPKYGDQVPRGAQIGVVGNTGYSTGPHVHIQVNPVGDLQSKQFKFELKLAPQGNVKGCYIPSQGEQLWSTN